MSSFRVVDVAIDPRSGGADAIYSYLPAGNVQVGDAVLAPLGHRQILGYAIGFRDVDEQSLGFDPAHLRPVAGVVAGLQIPTAIMETVRFVAQEYLCPLPAALTAAVPPGVRDRLVKVWMRTARGYESDLKPLEVEVLRVLDEESEIEEKESMQAGTEKALKALVAAGYADQYLRLKPIQKKKAAEGVYRLTSDTEKVERFLQVEGKKKPAQAVAIMQIQEADGSALSSAEIRAMASVTETTVKALIKAELLEEVDESDPRPTRQPPTPNPHQQIAIDAICHAIDGHQPKPFLLFGITGSGKTEVFLRSAGKALASGRQVLYLVPEIALATQAIAQLRERFGARIAILHSEQTPLERLQNWQLVRNGEASIVLGPRSALFAPLTNIGLIVLDEEHETGYKQEQSPRYHARTVARFLARQHNCPLVLGSATPSIETFAEAEANEEAADPDRLTLLTLPNRTASAVLPQVYIEDLSAGYRGGKPSLFGPLLTDHLHHTLESGNQAILFLNRRAYSPFLMCRDCGYQWMCPSCAVTLSYHRRDHRLKCHHCGYHESAPATCPQCEGTKIKPFGVGTEKVEELVAEEFPAARVTRLDRDVAQKKGALEEVIASFRSGEKNVLVGTQLVAKGLDFPNVTLVGVIAADVSLNLPDFRSSERTFQLLSQVAGRAGRGAKRGEVVIQTFNPDTPAIVYAQRHEYLEFFHFCLNERREAHYPPYEKLVNILMSGESRNSVIGLGAKILARLQTFESLVVLGPTDCVLERINNRWRRHILVKAPLDFDFDRIGQALEDVEEKGVQMVIDVDPFSLM
ncbi:MAG: primosomal protein N' [Armatimonadetes bacterium]|nr:primosomal protein N' [Armatimonadota bacterium]